MNPVLRSVRSLVRFMEIGHDCFHTRSMSPCQTVHKWGGFCIKRHQRLPVTTLPPLVAPILYEVILPWHILPCCTCTFPIQPPQAASSQSACRVSPAWFNAYNLGTSIKNIRLWATNYKGRLWAHQLKALTLGTSIKRTLWAHLSSYMKHSYSKHIGHRTDQIDHDLDRLNPKLPS